jgi:hypothetical protein
MVRDQELWLKKGPDPFMVGLPALGVYMSICRLLTSVDITSNNR